MRIASRERVERAMVGKPCWAVSIKNDLFTGYVYIYAWSVDKAGHDSVLVDGVVVVDLPGNVQRITQEPMKGHEGFFEEGDPPPQGYLQWHAWAEVQHKAGLRQKKCPLCGLYKFPQELSDSTFDDRYVCTVCVKKTQDVISACSGRVVTTSYKKKVKKLCRGKSATK